MSSPHNFVDFDDENHNNLKGLKECFICSIVINVIIVDWEVYIIYICACSGVCGVI